MKHRYYCPACCTIQNTANERCIICGEKLKSIIIEVQNGDKLKRDALSDEDWKKKDRYNAV